MSLPDGRYVEVTEWWEDESDGYGPNPRLDAWVQRVDAILTNGYALDLCRRRVMTDEEIAQAHVREWEEW